MKLSEYKTISKAVQADIEAVLNKHGFDLGNMSTSVDDLVGSVRWTINGFDRNLKGEDGKPTTPEAVAWKNYCHLLDLRPEWLGRTFTDRRGGKYTILGLKAGRTINDVVATGAGGKKYLFKPTNIAAEMKRLDLLGYDRPETQIFGGPPEAA